MKTALYIFSFIFTMTTTLLSSELIPSSIEDAAQKKYGAFAYNRFVYINKEILNALKDDSDMRKLNIVNSWMNGIRYKSDQKVYKQSDYWATLYEFIGKNHGDCEDYTIAKYYVLKELGIDPKRMKFTYVIYQNRRGKKISHMVLSYFKIPKPKNKDDILILDNNNRLILPASQRPDIVRVVKMINGDTGPKSKKWKKLEANMKRKKL